MPELFSRAHMQAVSFNKCLLAPSLGEEAIAALWLCVVPDFLKMTSWEDRWGIGSFKLEAK